MYGFQASELSYNEGCLPFALDSWCNKCSVDLLSGFWQTLMAARSKQYTAFVISTLGFYECKHMLFRLCNAPATFQHLMQNCLGKLNYTTCLVYLDDIVIYSSMQEEHLNWLRKVLEWFRLNGLKLKPSKCSFFWQEIEYLDHRVSAQGIRSSHDNLRATAEYPRLTTFTSICGFLGIVGHYCWFIKDFAKIAEPLHDYTRGDLHKKKKESLTLNEEAKEAFKALKRAIMTAQSSWIQTRTRVPAGDRCF